MKLLENTYKTLVLGFEKNHDKWNVFDFNAQYLLMSAKVRINCNYRMMGQYQPAGTFAIYALGVSNGLLSSRIT